MNNQITKRYSKLSKQAKDVFNYLLSEHRLSQHNLDENNKPNSKVSIKWQDLIDDNIIHFVDDLVVTKSILKELSTFSIYISSNTINNPNKDRRIKDLISCNYVCAFTFIRLDNVINKETKDSELILSYKINQDFVDVVSNYNALYMTIDLDKLFKMSDQAVVLYEVLYNKSKELSTGEKPTVEITLNIDDLKKLLGVDNVSTYKESKRFSNDYLIYKCQEIIDVMDWKKDLTIYPQTKLHKDTKKRCKAPYITYKKGLYLDKVKFLVTDLSYAGDKDRNPKWKDIKLSRLQDYNETKKITKIVKKLVAQSTLSKDGIKELINSNIEKIIKDSEDDED